MLWYSICIRLWQIARKFARALSRHPRRDVRYAKTTWFIASCISILFEKAERKNIFEVIFPVIMHLKYTHSQTFCRQGFQSQQVIPQKRDLSALSWFTKGRYKSRTRSTRITSPGRINSDQLGSTRIIEKIKINKKIKFFLYESQLNHQKYPKKKKPCYSSATSMLSSHRDPSLFRGWQQVFAWRGIAPE